MEILEGILFPPPGDLPHPGIKPRSPPLQVDSLPAELPGNPWLWWLWGVGGVPYRNLDRSRFRAQVSQGHRQAPTVKVRVLVAFAALGLAGLLAVAPTEPLRPRKLRGLGDGGWFISQEEVRSMLKSAEVKPMDAAGLGTRAHRQHLKCCRARALGACGVCSWQNVPFASSKQMWSCEPLSSLSG